MDGHGYWPFGFAYFSLSAATATNGFTVDPAGYRPWVARSSSGLLWLGFGHRRFAKQRSRPSASLRLRPPRKTEGSNVGFEASATIFPLRGSMTMTAPPVALRYWPEVRSAVWWARSMAS